MGSQMSSVPVIAAQEQPAVDAPKPKTIFSDRGPGCYHRRHGSITSEYDAACHRHGFKLWAGANAKTGLRAQSPDVGDVLLHETATS